MRRNTKLLLLIKVQIGVDEAKFINKIQDESKA